ncbi:pyrroline-5-carboxylate reductase [Noviherbaspirillum malthae]|jgi:pyrroline-5-carboxylate reductase|uniref:pyrroline-5-carboxylate reductase n=1 Tax=Noviherbaspirillum malthae TaxID=1260987 RepID=UPI00188FF6BB|nr:pyrroline-5-carboxylate reductase [Noviherbaspirillum malthae]
MNQLKIGFVGAGNMATALIGGLAGQLVNGSNIHVVVRNAISAQKLRLFGVSTATIIDAKLTQCDVIVLAVKPQQMEDVTAQLRPYVSNQLILSIAAGIRTADISRWLGGHRTIIRTMPNTPALIGKGITGMVAMDGVLPWQRRAADDILRAVGATLWVSDENLIDPVTAVSGSGPAYVFYFIEAMQQAGQEMGLTVDQSRQLAVNTFVGASQLAAQSLEADPLLCDPVTYKDGTMHSAVASMDASGVKDAISKAMKLAAIRGKELGEEFCSN